ncbi:hypothetical protein [Emticicia sp. 17c]|uniref:hypothetical protein n=1 Tax=Emticicia sp. 17c TaxID=3127704 RepID=UPI00301D4EDE
MKENIEEKIVKLLRSHSSRDREEGCHLLEKAFKTRVTSWVRKQQGRIPPEDIWQSAALNMILAIQTQKYQIIPGVQMYTFFHHLVKAAWIKEAKHILPQEDIQSRENDFEQTHEEFNPEIAFDVNQKRRFISECLEKLDQKSKDILKAILYEGKRVVDIHEEFDLKNHNNAKQRFFNAKNKLIACLKKHFGYGNE